MPTKPIRRRPRRTGQFLTLATVAAAIAGMVVWNRHLNAAPTFAIPAPAPTPNPNAFDDFVRAAKLHREPSVYKNGKTVTLPPTQVDAVFADNAAAVQALHMGFTHPFQMPTDRSMTSKVSVYSYYSGFRGLARMLGYETQQRAARGDTAGAADAGLDCLQMGVRLPRGSNEVSLMVGIACDAIGRKNLWPVVGRLNAAQTADAARRLEAIEAQRTPLADTLSEEKWRGLTVRLELLRQQSVPAAYRVLVHPSTNGDASDGSSDADAIGSSRHPFRNWVSLACLSKQQVVDDYARWMDTQIAAANRPYGERDSSQAGESSAPADLLNQAIDGPNSYQQQIRFKDAADRADDGLLMTLLALRAYRLQTGGYPASLDALVTSGILHALPSDPFAHAANVPFGYRRLSGDQFRLYSVGPDGMDDGGRPIDLTKGPSSRSKSATPYADAADTGDWVVGVDIPAVGSGAG